jgi:septum formation protein
MNKKLILASASPRRKDLLNSIGLEFEVIPSQIEENLENQSFSLELIENLAKEKALEVAGKINFPALIIGSDTVVVIDNEILGKPSDLEDAARMIKMLSGKTHKVVSAIFIYDTETKKSIANSVTSEVTFRELEQAEIINYVNTKEPLDKAGAYAIQGKAGIFVKSINGCYSNIVGISVFRVAQILKEFGIRIL